MNPIIHSCMPAANWSSSLPMCTTLVTAYVCLLQPTATRAVLARIPHKKRTSALVRVFLALTLAGLARPRLLLDNKYCCCYTTAAGTADDSAASPWVCGCCSTPRRARCSRM